MFIPSAGLTAIDVSLWGPLLGCAQSVFTFAASEVVVVQSAIPCLPEGARPNWLPGSGLGAFSAFLELSNGRGLSSAATENDWPTATAAAAARMTRLKPTPAVRRQVTHPA